MPITQDRMNDLLGASEALVSHINRLRAIARAADLTPDATRARELAQEGDMRSALVLMDKALSDLASTIDETQLPLNAMLVIEREKTHFNMHRTTNERAAAAQRRRRLIASNNEFTSP